MVIEAGLTAAYVIRWALSKAKKAGKGLDNEVDTAIDATLAKLHDVVVGKLGGHPALGDLEEEAARQGQVSELTRQQVELAIQAAANKDDAFAKAVAAAADQVKAADKAGGQAAAMGQEAVAVAGAISMHAETGSAVAWRMDTVNIGQPDGQEKQSRDPSADPR